eukprot:4270684-Lingulodinium_polyedra.AAC.1
MWYRFPGLWKYKCLVCWEPLVHEAQKRPDEKILGGRAENLVSEYGDNIKKRSNLGCEANVVPWKKGASTVLEMQTKDGDWLSSMAD